MIGFQFESAGDFGDGLAPVKLSGKWGYIDHSGKIAIEPQFADAASFSEGLAEVTFDEVRPFPGFAESLARLDEPAYRKWGFIDQTSKMLIAPQFTLSGKFSQGLAPVGFGKESVSFNAPPDQKWGYIDKAGKVVIGPQFNSAGEFAEGLAAVKVGGKWGYIDTTGKLVIAPKFEYAGVFNGGLASVAAGYTKIYFPHRGVSVISMKIVGKRGYIDRTGRFVPKMTWKVR